MNPFAARILLLCLGIGILIPLGGCAEGPLWRLGAYTPWARSEWEKEEKIATTMYARRERIRSLADDAEDMSAIEQERACQELAANLQPQSPVILRLESIRALGRFSVPAAGNLLSSASIDTDPQVRATVCTAWGNRGGSEAVDALHRVLTDETDIDVRLAATRALGKFRSRTAFDALTLALNDKDPAMQVRAMDSLKSVTGEDFGYSVAAWQQYVSGGDPESLPPARISEAPSYEDRSTFERLFGTF